MSVEPAAAQVVDRIAHLLHDAIGLRPESNLRGRISRTVLEQSAAQGLSPQSYLRSILAHGEAFQQLLNSVTVQESGFFRHPEQFAVLAAEVLPALRQPVVIWSAGCANGQEAYSLAMLLDECHVEGSVVASDLSTAALERTALGVYATREIGGLSPERRARYLTGSERHGWQLDPALLRRVTLAQHNVLQPLPPQVLNAQVVFCRNLLIYLSPEHTRAFLDRLADAYPVGTTLFIGAAEVLWQVTGRFATIRSGSTFRYERRDPISSSAPAPIRGPALAPARAAVLPPVRAAALPPAPTARPAVQALAARPATTSLNSFIEAQRLNLAGQLAIAERDHRAAVIAFRACAYLTPHDPLAHLHLGLALEAVGDKTAARNTYGVARRAWLDADPATVEAAGEGYSFAELGRLIDAKQGAQ